MGRRADPAVEARDREETSYPAPGRGAARNGRRSRSQFAGALAFLLLAFLLAAGIGLLVALWVGDDSAGPERGATIAEVVESPGEYVGEQVTVSGTVGALAPFDDGVGEPLPEETPAAPGPGALAFTIGGDVVDEQLLVVSADGTPFRVVTETSVVQVTGTVRRFTRERFAEVYGDGLFDDGLFQEFGGRPVLVASSVDPTVPAEDAAEG